MKPSLHILDELTEAKSTLAQADKVNPYYLPENYFIDFPANVRASVFISGIGNGNPFTIDSAYFENFPQQVLNKIEENSSALLPGKTSYKEIFQVPELYFENLSDNILGKIKSAQKQKSEAQLEMEELSPLLAGISKANVYAVPEYFFSQQLIHAPQAAEAEKPVKVIEMRPKRTWLAYAAAACVVFVLSTLGIRYYNQNQHEYTAQATKHDEYNSLSSVNVQQAINNLSDDEIYNYLDKQSSNSIDITPADNSQSIDVNGLIQNIPDNEIENYLKQNSYPADNDVSGI